MDQVFKVVPQGTKIPKINLSDIRMRVHLCKAYLLLWRDIDDHEEHLGVFMSLDDAVTACRHVDAGLQDSLFVYEFDVGNLVERGNGGPSPVWCCRKI